MTWKKTLPTVLLTCLTACGAAPADEAATPVSVEVPTASQAASPSATAAPPASQEARLIRYKDNLYIRNAPTAVTRNRLYYVFAEEPIPGSSDHPKIGIVRVMDQEGSSVQVVWWTLVDDDVEHALQGEGLLVELVGQDLEKRVGRHWTTFEVMPDKTPGSTIIVSLALGADDGIKATDKYELLGEPRADPVNLTVDDFTPLGTCTVLPFDVDRGRARCQLGITAEAPRLGPGTKVQHGYARAATPRVKK